MAATQILQAYGMINRLIEWKKKHFKGNGGRKNKRTINGAGNEAIKPENKYRGSKNVYPAQQKIKIKI